MATNSVTLGELIERIKAALSDDLRSPRYQGNPNPMAGHCYVASEVAYNLLGGKAAGWTPAYVNHEGSTHWFLYHALGGVVDITVSQFTNPPPYAKATRCGFLTRNPSRRARIVMGRMLDNLKNG